ncbi:MAG: DNA polymerase IV [Rhodospirillales bacterium]|nr:DNA polymerase IV [Rhodospirillales bacterium]
MPTLCRDCTALESSPAPSGRCPRCGSRRLVGHPELTRLSLAHIDCDAFYAAVEKRDNPAIRGKPVIVGGGRRGVVSACCYIARIKGVRSAMPMFEARARCPEAVVISPDMQKYAAVGRQILALMQATTPLVEPLSIDEAFLDLAGTEGVNGGSAAETLAKLALRIETEIGVTVSVGLSYNKFLAKVASDLDKPRGFAVIGRAEAVDFLKERPVGLIPGVGKVLQKQLADDGIRLIGDLARHGEAALTKRYGTVGGRLARLSAGEDGRGVDPEGPAKSLSAETTFEADLADPKVLARELWRLCERLSDRLKKVRLGAGGITLKLKTRRFRLITRSRQLGQPTMLAEEIYRNALPLLEVETDGRRFRLIGIGASRFVDAEDADAPDLIDPIKTRRAKVERAIDDVRRRFGLGAIGKGRSLRRGGGR